MTFCCLCLTSGKINMTEIVLYRTSREAIILGLKYFKMILPNIFIAVYSL